MAVVGNKHMKDAVITCGEGVTDLIMLIFCWSLSTYNNVKITRALPPKRRDNGIHAKDNKNWLRCNK